MTTLKMTTGEIAIHISIATLKRSLLERSVCCNWVTFEHFWLQLVDIWLQFYRVVCCVDICWSQSRLSLGVVPERKRWIDIYFDISIHMCMFHHISISMDICILFWFQKSIYFQPWHFHQHLQGNLYFHWHLHVVLNRYIDILLTFPLTFARNPVDIRHWHLQGSESISVCNLTGQYGRHLYTSLVWAVGNPWNENLMGVYSGFCRRTNTHKSNQSSLVRTWLNA